MITRRFLPPHGVAMAVVSGAAVCVLAGCGGGGGGSGSPKTSSSPAPGTPSTPTATTGSPGSSPSAARNKANAALLRAGATAEGAVHDGTLISIETEDNGARWEAQVVTADGTEHELDVSKDGGKVVSGPTAKQEDANDKTKHQRRVQAAKLDYRQAARKASGAVKNGRITELNLDTYRGTTVWEADVLPASGTKHSVKVDAKTGKVVANQAGSSD